MQLSVDEKLDNNCFKDEILSEFNDTEYNLCKNARKLFDYLYKTEKLVTEYKYQKPNME